MKILRFLTPVVIFVAVLCIGIVTTLSGKVHPAWVVVVGGAAYLAALAGKKCAEFLFSDGMTVTLTPPADCIDIHAVRLHVPSGIWTLKGHGIGLNIKPGRFLLVPMPQEGSAKQ